MPKRKFTVVIEQDEKATTSRLFPLCAVVTPRRKHWISS